MKQLICYIFFVFIITGNCVFANADSAGIVAGKLIIDNSWVPKVYLSRISNLNEMYTMSGKMIVAETPLDSLGNFHFDLGFLTNEESLLRIHLVKKGNPVTTLVIGGRNENHFFFIANNKSKISIENIKSEGLFGNVKIAGSPSTVIFNRINEIADYPNLLNYDSIPIEKQYVEKAVNERLKQLADTCQNPLVSLYALHKSNFETDYSQNKEFYHSYIKKWEANKSSYFRAFRKQLPIQLRNWDAVFSIIIFILLGVGMGFYIRYRRDSKFDKLSVQERKIFSLIQQGATNQEISAQCHIEVSTVKTHVSNIFSKLKVKSRKEILNMKQ